METKIELLANRITAEGLSVRAVEEIVATRDGKSKSSKPKRAAVQSPRLKEVADLVGNKLDTRVSVELGPTKRKDHY